MKKKNITNIENPNTATLKLSGLDNDNYIVTINGIEIKDGDTFHVDAGSSIKVIGKKRDFTVTSENSPE